MKYCQKLIVNCLIYQDEKLVGSGYNMPLSPCDNVSCHHDNHCINTAHAEIVALLQAGQAAQGGVMYVSHYPCWHCRKAIIAAGIAMVYYDHDYRCDHPDKFKEGVEWVKK